MRHLDVDNGYNEEFCIMESGVFYKYISGNK